PAITAAIQAHMAEHGVSESAVRRQVRKYLDEIIPHFNVLSYYKVGYNLAKIVVNLLYKMSVDYQDEAALARIPKRDVVVYVMNHRSNADYVVIAYVLAYGVHVSYAVGEWARAWPLEYLFKSFGAYFIRRRFREPLYHAVLERYIHLITHNGVTQGFFPDGRLSRNGRLAPANLGLLERMDALRDRLREVNGKVVRGGSGIEDIWDRAWRMLHLRRLVVQDGSSLVVLPRGRPLLEYYANSIAHLLPVRGERVPFHKE